MFLLHPFNKAASDLGERPKGNLPELDVLRTAAILLVISTHVGSTFLQSQWFARVPLVSSGWTGVDLFFVLSGYLIGRQLWKEATQRKIRIGRFLLRRGMRIWPLYFSFVVFVGILIAVQGRPLTPLLADLLCVSNFFRHYVARGWSLSTEEQFYLITPVALALLLRFWPSRRLWLLPVAWLALLPLARWWWRGGLTGAAAFSRIYAPIFTHSDGLAVGMLLAWWALHDARKLRPVPVLACSVALASALFAAGPLYQFTAWAVFYGGVALAMLSGLRLPGQNWIGYYVVSRLSYGMYLNHPFLMGYAERAARAVAGSGFPAFALQWTLVTAMSVSAAFLTFALIELPFLRLRERKIGPGAATSAAAAAASGR